jgi:hypothetical protein
MRNRMRDAIPRGAIAGLAATFPMTALMLVAERLGWMSELPPTRIVRRTMDELPGASPSGAGLSAATAVLHLGIGAVAGGAYAALTDTPPLVRIPATMRGLLAGTILWVLAYVGALPAIGLMPAPQDDERRRPAAMLTAHLVFGGTLAWLDGWACRRAERGRVQVRD